MELKHFVLRIFSVSPLFVLCQEAPPTTRPTPVVVWHGLFDSCCSSLVIPYGVRITGNLVRIIEDQFHQRNHTDAYVHSICGGRKSWLTGDCILYSDAFSSFYDRAVDHIEKQCKILLEDENLREGFNFIGFSQGGILGRGLVQLCPGLRIKKFIAVGSPLNGIRGFPTCQKDNSHPRICAIFEKIIKDVDPYSELAQKKIMPAQYWAGDAAGGNATDSGDLLKTLNSSKHPHYQDLERLVLVRFMEDSVVIPTSSEWLGVESENSDFDELEMFERLGLHKLRQEGRLDLLKLWSGHLRFSDKWFISEIVEKYLID